MGSGEEYEKEVSLERLTYEETKCTRRLNDERLVWSETNADRDDGD